MPIESSFIARCNEYKEGVLRGWATGRRGIKVGIKTVDDAIELGWLA
jgi:hypothetical protein